MNLRARLRALERRAGSPDAAMAEFVRNEERAMRTAHVAIQEFYALAWEAAGRPDRAAAIGDMSLEQFREDGHQATADLPPEALMTVRDAIVAYASKESEPSASA